MSTSTIPDPSSPRPATSECEPRHPGTGLTASQFQRAERRAEVRRTRWRDLQLEQQAQRDFDEEVATTEQAIATAPPRLDLDAFLAEYPHLEGKKARVVADGQMIYLRPGTKRWSLTLGNGRTIVRAVEFRAPGTTDLLGKPAGIRAVTELAALLAGVHDAQGRSVPWTSPHRTWWQGWHGENSLTLAGAITPIVSDWAARHGADYVGAHRGGGRRERPIVGGVRDLDGFVLGRAAAEAAPGDRVRHDGRIYTVVDTRVARVRENGNPRHRLILTLEHDGEQTILAEPGRVDIDFTGDPDAPEARHNPGMGSFLELPGIPVDRQNPHYVSLRREDLLPPGTSVLVRRTGERTGFDGLDGWCDPRPVVGTATDHVLSELGHDFQVFEMADRTFDAIKPSAFPRTNPRATTEYRCDPDPADVTAVLAAWGLPRLDQS
jgi:hypothetical protein